MDFDLAPAHELFSKSKIALSDHLKIGEKVVAIDKIIKKLEPLLTPDRISKLKQVIAHRNPNVVTVLENIYDRGNVSAVMRTAEALGFFRFSIIEEQDARFKAANRVTKGAEKWLDIQVHSDVAQALDPLKRENFLILGTDLEASHSFDEIEFNRPVAIVIGNEKDGISEAMREYVDIRVKLPMVGFSQSFNLSVASALVLNQAFQKSKKNHMAVNDVQFQQLYANYLLRCVDRPEKLF